MSNELRYNHIHQCWVSVSTGRATKSSDFPISKVGAALDHSADNCPFCAGRESLTPPEILAVRPSDTPPDSPGWQVRVFENKFSAFEMDRPFSVTKQGSCTSSPGFGHHEVVVEAPNHFDNLPHLSLEHVKGYLSVLKERYNSLSQDTRFKYIHIYKNCGVFGGASMVHEHSQIIAMPFEDSANSGMDVYYANTGKCVVCETLSDTMDSERLIYKGDKFAIISPYAPRFAYEAWIVPLEHQSHFGEIEDGALSELSVLLKCYLGGMLEALDNPSYQLAIVTAPLEEKEDAAYHWYIEIAPKLLVPSAVEMSADVFINFAAPEVAGPMLKEKFEKWLQQNA